MRRLMVAVMLVGVLVQKNYGQDNKLYELKLIINESDTYVNQRIQRIESLKEKLTKTAMPSSEVRFAITSELFQEYKAFIYDSAIHYARQLSMLARKTGDRGKLEYARVKIAFALNSAGLFKETFDTLRLINTKYLNDSTRIEYYNLMARANFDLGEFDANSYFYKLYHAKANQFLDSGMMLCPKGTYEYLDMSNYKHLMNNEIEAGLKDVMEVLSFDKLNYHQRAICFHHLAGLYLKAGDTLKGKHALIESSINDIKGAIKETTSTTELANLLYISNDIEDAYVLIRKAMADAQYYGARQRKARIASLLPLIAAERINQEETRRRALITYSVMITVFVFFILVFVIVTRRQYKKLQLADRQIKEANERLTEINKHLREADKIKEEYIGYYFNITSDYINKLENFRDSINQKLLTRKFDDLRFITDSIDVKKEKEDLYKGFDEVFVKLFPDFVSDFNALFPNENRFELKDGQILNTEMRIFALIRLGIQDTESISRILGYSVNTIYTYKTKVKSKSLIPNEEFESRIKDIKSVHD